MSSGLSSYPVELLTPVEMAKADRLATTTIPSAELMRNAGKAVAEAALRWLGRHALPRRVLVLCGPGNNGGDGYVAACRLAEAGVAVTLLSLVDRSTLSGDAADAAAAWTGPVGTLADARLDDVGLVIDALFGAGLTRDIEGSAAVVIARLNDWARTTRRPILAVDIPSGVDGASGAIRGSAVEAHETVTFFRLKPGHVLMPGRTRCGTLTLVDIGIEASVLDTIDPATRLNTPTLWAERLPFPSVSGHKYSRGHAVVMSGPVAQTGAARLAARGALRIGAGLVTMATPTEALLVHAAALTAVMTRVVDDAEDLRELLADPRKNALVLGPGLGVGDRTRALVLAALRPGGRDAPARSVVLDADALVSFADRPHVLFDAIRASGRAVVLTPHDGEFAKLFGRLLDCARPKPERTREASAASGAVVLLKGADTVVAAPDGRASIAANDAPWLATAGSGDVLSGFVTGLLAQGMPPFEAASAAVWLHAEAARLFGPGLISEDIADMLPRVFRELQASRERSVTMS